MNLHNDLIRQYDYVLNFQGKPTSGSWQGGNSPKNDQLFN